MISAQWLTDLNCGGPPTSMYVIPGEAANPFYHLVTQEFSPYSCGILLFPESLRCCYQSLDLSLSESVKSGFHYPESQNTADLPSSANGISYCTITSIDSNSFDSYQQLYLLPGVCVDGRYKCENNVLSLYNNSLNCENAFASFKVGETIDSEFGKASFSVSTFTDGQNSFIWTSLTPSYNLVPNFKDLQPVETFCLILYILALLESLWACFFYLKHYLKSGASFMLHRLVLHVFWVLLVIAKFLYWIIQFPDIESFAIFSQIMSMVYNLTTLLTVLQSAFFLNKYLNFKPKILKKINIYVLILVHVGLAGALYIDYWNNVPNPLQQAIFQWNQSWFSWIIFVFLYDLLPVMTTIRPLLRTLVQTEDGSYGQIFYNVCKAESLLAISFLGQVPVLILYVVLSILKNGTAYQNDRNALALEGLFIFLLLLHTLLVVIVMERVPKLLKLSSSLSRSTGLKSVTLSISQLRKTQVTQLRKTQVTESICELKLANCEQIQNVA